MLLAPNLSSNCYGAGGGRANAGPGGAHGGALSGSLDAYVNTLAGCVPVLVVQCTARCLHVRHMLHLHDTGLPSPAFL